MKALIPLVIAITTLVINAVQSQTPTTAFTTIEGATLKARMDAATRQGQARGTRFWAAYSFDVRPQVSTDTDGINTGNAMWVNGVSIGANSETRNLAVFLLYDAATITRIEVYNLDRKREYSGYPVFWLGRANNEESLNFLRGLVDSQSDVIEIVRKPKADRAKQVVRLPDYEAVAQDPVLYAHASRVLHLEANPGNARALVQKHGDREVWLNPPPIPLTTKEMDYVYDMPYARKPHPAYGDAKIPAWEMIRFSVNIMRGCFGGCTFCSITEHEGRIIQSRSEASILKEVEEIRDKVDGFTGVISDLGGPTANMYRIACKSETIEKNCRKLSCVYPGVCENLNTDHTALIQLYRKARAIKGVKKILISSGVRYDLAVKSPEYVKELVQHHVGGYLKIAPEHSEENVLSKMMKPGMDAYDEFKAMFEKFSDEAGKKQYLIPYFIAAHPGTTDLDMLNLALWLKKYDFKLDQVQTFTPTPMAMATAMYHSGKNPLRKVTADSDDVPIPKAGNVRKLHKAFIRYHDPNNWPMLREALIKMGREDLIGNGKQHLIPAWQPLSNKPITTVRGEKLERTIRPRRVSEVKRKYS